MTLGSFIPRKAQIEQKFIVFIENWKEIGPKFLLIWIAQWVFLILVIFRGYIEVKAGQKKQTLGTVKILGRNSSFSKSFKWHLYNYKDYLWLKFQVYLTLFTGVIAPKPTKIGPVGFWDKETFLFLLGKADNNKYPEAETWHPESIDECSYYRLVRISDNLLTWLQVGNSDPI